MNKRNPFNFSFLFFLLLSVPLLFSIGHNIVDKNKSIVVEKKNDEKPDGKLISTTNDVPKNNTFSGGNIVNHLKKNYPEIYGGFYTDENAKQILTLVESDKTIDITEFKKIGVEIKYVQFTLKELNQTIGFLSPKMKELKIDALELDEKYNKVNVYIKNLNTLKKETVKEIVANPEILQFIESIGEITF